MTNLADISAVELARLIQLGEVSAVEATEAALNRIEARKELNAFITVCDEKALEAARQADKLKASGATLPELHGIPYSVKDLVNTAGVRTTMGSPMFSNNVPTSDAASVARAKAAGAILIGKTTTPEFGHKQGADGPLFGRTLNPVNPKVTPGASSCGAAVAVVAGMGPIAIGSDGGGSIRIPASCCGIVGLKATLGRIPHLQVPDLFGANSYIGPMARTVADTKLLYRVIQGPSAGDPYGQAIPASPAPRKFLVGRPLTGLKVAWLPTCGNRIDPQVEASTTNAVNLLSSSGAQVEVINLDFVSLEPHFLVFLQSMIAARTRQKLDQFRDVVDPSLVATAEKGKLHSAVDLQEAAFARTRCFQQLQEVFSRFDVMVSPTVSAPPLSIDVDPNGIVEIAGKPAGTVRGAWYPYTYPMNLTGHPALSMPCGTTSTGLPIGLQIAAGWYQEDTIFAVADWLEHALGLASL